MFVHIVQAAEESKNMSLGSISVPRLYVADSLQ